MKPTLLEVITHIVVLSTLTAATLCMLGMTALIAMRILEAMP